MKLKFSSKCDITQEEVAALSTKLLSNIKGAVSIQVKQESYNSGKTIVPAFVLLVKLNSNDNVGSTRRAAVGEVLHIVLYSLNYAFFATDRAHFDLRAESFSSLSRSLIHMYKNIVINY